MSTTTLAPQRPAPGRLRLPGQADAPDGPVDLTLMWVMHHGFRRDLAAFGRAVERTPLEDRRTWELLRRRWDYFASVLHHHHTGEDAGLWPLLLERAAAAGDAEGRAILEAMAAEHAAIDPLLGECSHGFARLAGVADGPAREALAAAVAAARVHVDRHLAHEERDGMRVLQDHLQPADWEWVGARFFDTAYTTPRLLELVAWVLHEMPPEGVAALERQERGRALVAVWRLALRRPFRRRERAAFRHA
ncbi:hypothetical protein GCM10027261_23110 [Geodermatophilus arenarius]|uniref:Hemerythrin domain-containing protein n=1 Tax=Geodermatophilus arenarius TaxID=1137990 RepID=A0ABV9LJY9_9ACTN